MLRKQILLTVVIFILGCPFAFARTAQVNPHETNGQTDHQKVELLEAKIKALESLIDKHLPTAPLDMEPQLNSPEVAQKIQDINDRIERFNKKPYLDPKGFKRASLKRIKGKLIQELRDTTIRTVGNQDKTENPRGSHSAPGHSQQHS